MAKAPHRKRLLLSFALLGAIAATLFLALPSSSPIWYISALLAILANVGFGASVVAMNAYLPSLAKDSPEVVAVLQEIEQADEDHNNENENLEVQNARISERADEPLLPRAPEEQTSKLGKRYDNELSRATSRISSLGIALGYGAGICLLIVALIPVTMLHGSTFSLRLAIGLSGIWWAVFSIPAALWLPGAGTGAVAVDDTPVWTDGADLVDGKWTVWREIAAAWRRLGGMLRWREIRRLRNTFKYLGAWFLLSDGEHIHAR